MQAGGAGREELGSPPGGDQRSASPETGATDLEASLSLFRTNQRRQAVLVTYESGDAAPADGGLEVTLQLLLDGAGGVEALGQKNDGVYKEEGGDAVDDVLKDLDPGHGQTNGNSEFPSSCGAETA